MAKHTSELAGEKAAPKPKKMVGKMKVQGNIKHRLYVPNSASLFVLEFPDLLTALQCVK